MDSTFEIAVLGDANVDLVLEGLPLDLPLEREVLASGMGLTLGGSGAIFAHNAAVLGNQVAFAGKLGRDLFGGFVLDRLRDAGVDDGGICFAEDGSGTGLTVLLPNAERRRILTYPGTIATYSGLEVPLAYIRRAGHLHVASLFLQTGLHGSLAALLRDARTSGMTVSLDTNDDPADAWGGVLWEVLQHSDVLLPNEEEACRMTNCATAEAAADVLLRHLPLAVIKCGKRGALLAGRTQRRWVHGQALDVVDTIGAGDSFDAGFVHGLVRGWPTLECADFANRVAALSTTGRGGTEAFRDRAAVWQALGLVR